MSMLAADPRTVFVGQAVGYRGQRAHATFRDVPAERRIEMPVAEDFQMGFCTGLALTGAIPVSFFPRWDFLLLAANQLVNHLDKLQTMGWTPQVIIRTAVGASRPLDPGPQHVQNHTEAFRRMLTTVSIFDIASASDVVPAYRAAIEGPGPAIVVEHMEFY